MLIDKIVGVLRIISHAGMEQIDRISRKRVFKFNADCSEIFERLSDRQFSCIFEISTITAAELFRP